MKSDSIKTAVIIITYNGKNWLNVCIPPLYDSENVELIIIDNDSKDDTCALIKENFPNVILIESKENLGFGKANNLGLKLALEMGFDFVFLQNQDASISQDQLDKIIALSKENQSYGILSPTHFKNENDIENLFLSYTKHTSYQRFDQSSNNIIEIDFVNAALWLLPIKTVKEIGGFNPIFPHYGEDFDYINRVKFFGYKIGFCEGVKGFHFRDYEIKKIRSQAPKGSHFGPWPVKYYSILTNINHSGLMVLSKACYLFIVSLVKHFLQLNFNSIRWDFKVFSEVIKKMPHIFKKNRKQISQKGELFL